MAGRTEKIVKEILDQAAAQQQLQADAELARLRAELAGLRSKYKNALAQMDRERERADVNVRTDGRVGGRLIEARLAHPHQPAAADRVNADGDNHRRHDGLEDQADPRRHCRARKSKRESHDEQRQGVADAP